MAAYTKHPDYFDDDELFYSSADLYYLVYRKDIPESLVHMKGHQRFMIGSIRDFANDLVFYRIPAAVYDIQAAFGTFPVRTLDNYLW